MSSTAKASPPIEPELRLTIPHAGSRLRWVALVYGGGLLIWSSLEDNSVLPVALLGGGLALLLLTLWVTRRYAARQFSGRSALITAAIFGAAAGAGGAVATATLMLIKVGLHSHLFPDYPFGLIVAMLLRAPVWDIAGAFAGVGLLLAWSAYKHRP